MVTAQLEKIFFHKAQNEHIYRNLIDSRYFDNADLKELWKLVKAYNEKYADNPNKMQLKELVKLKGLGEAITEDKIDAFYDVDIKDYDSDWIKESIETWIEFKNLDAKAIDLLTYLKTTTVNSENIKDVVNNAYGIFLNNTKVDFKFDLGLNFFDAASHYLPPQNKFPTGWEYLDLVTDGGWSLKTLNVFAGAPKVGKSIFLSNVATNSVLNGNNTCLISCEMEDRKFIRRLGSNLLNIPIRDYKNIIDNDPRIIEKLKNISLDNGNFKQPGQLYVKEFATSQASVLDIEAHLKQAEKALGIKFKMVVIDYINILKNYRNPNTENTYMKIKQIAEDLRAIAQRNMWCIVSATQFNRSGTDTTDVTLENISESSGLIHTVDLLMGIIQDPMMYMDKYYMLKALATRDEGYKNSRQRFNINYDYMRLTQDSSTIIY